MTESSNEWEERVDTNMLYLQKHLKVNKKLLYALMAEKLIDKEEKADITASGDVSALIDIARYKGPGSFQKFCAGLRKAEMAWAADKLEGDPSKGGRSPRAPSSLFQTGENVIDSGRTLDSHDDIPFDVCIITAVQIEFNAARKVLEGIANQEMIQKVYKADYGDFQYWEVEWPRFFPDDESRPLKIALLQQTRMGMEEAAKTIVRILTAPLLRTAKVVAMTGFCGGGLDKVKLGDLLIPSKIVKRTGKEKADGKFKGDTHPVELGSVFVQIVNGVVSDYKDDYKWKEYIPEDEQDVPSPALLQDTILTMMKDWDGMRGTKDEIVEKFHDLGLCWKPNKVKGPTINEAVDKLEKSEMLAKTEDERFEITEEGRGKGKDVGNHYKEYPTELKSPVIHKDTLLTIDFVSESLDFEKARSELAQRKIYGVDMEGYSFLDFAKTFLPRTKAIFIKGVSDLVSESTKMDYYQPYCAASATAFLCHLLKSNPDLFN